MSELFLSLQQLEKSDVIKLLENDDSELVEPSISKKRLEIEDLALLLSPGAVPLMEQIALRSASITRARFGKAVGLYAPLYVSNKCSGSCPYCGFKKTEKIERRSLSLDEIRAEGQALKETGIRQVLLVSGDGKNSKSNFLEEAIAILKPDFPSVTVEVPPMEVDDYAKLMKAGADGVTLYQETYHKPTFDRLHSDSPKHDYLYRLDALSRAGEAGMRKLNPGSLWGLYPWRYDALMLGAHVRYLEKNNWKSQISIGMPRLHTVPEDFSIEHPVSDSDFCQILLAMRLFSNDASIVVSTREKPEFRDNLLAIGATQFSAGSKTDPGGYTTNNQSGKQFKIDDYRSPRDVQADLLKHGYDPVFKDWDVGFVD